jgi:hypothetical protein
LVTVTEATPASSSGFRIRAPRRRAEDRDRAPAEVDAEVRDDVANQPGAVGVVGVPGVAARAQRVDRAGEARALGDRGAPPRTPRA